MDEYPEKFQTAFDSPFVSEFLKIYVNLRIFSIGNDPPPPHLRHLLKGDHNLRPKCPFKGRKVVFLKMNYLLHDLKHLKQLDFNNNW